MTQTTFVFTTDYKNEFKRYVDELFTRVKHDMETGGELAFKHVHREPREGDYVILRGETKPVKYDEKAHKAEEFAAVLVSDRSKRMKLVEDLTEAYITQTGRRPDPAQLDRLATLCLYEEVTDATPWKTRNTEYPVHSDRQREEIEKHEVGMAPLEYVASDGRKHEKPTRRKRSKAENAYMDRKYKGKGSGK